MAGEATGFIIVGVRPDRFEPVLAKGDDLRVLAREAGAIDLATILDEFPEYRTERVVSSVSVERIRELERRAAKLGFERGPSLASYWRVDARKPDRRQQIVERLASTESVERVYLEMAGSDPAVDPTDDPFAIQQAHLDAAPVGIDARWAWTQPHGSGATIGFVDLEQGWNLNHEDLPAIAPLPGVSQDINPPSVRHGTGVLGISVGVDNTLGIIGAAPKPAWVGIASHFRASDGTNGHIADTLTAVLASGVPVAGDVILIEWQDGSNRPTETDPVVWCAIELATALGIVVIEPAGNGNLDLDAVPELNRSNPATFKDSRAIIVGGSESGLDSTGIGHDRWILASPGPGSNFGSRVDCYAYAENVVTAGPAATPAGVLAGNGPNDAYRSDFGGTSAAAAVVAGAALVLQGMHKAIKGAPLSPVSMRDALSSWGTPQGPGVPGNIGVLPNLKRIAGALKLLGGSPAPPSNLRIQP